MKHLLLQISAISAKRHNSLGRLCYWTLYFQDNGPWKWKILICSKSISNCTSLRTFTLWIFFSKKWCLFQFNIYFSNFWTTYGNMCRFLTSFWIPCYNLKPSIYLFFSMVLLFLLLIILLWKLYWNYWFQYNGIFNKTMTISFTIMLR